MFKHEVAIIGGGPAGSAAALFLREYGLDVCVVEKKEFPRETLCGEFLSLEVIRNLRELNLFEKFILLQPNKINSFSFYETNGKSFSSDFGFDAYALKRSQLDSFFLSSAKEKGAAVYQPDEIMSIERGEDGFILSLKEGNKIKCRYLISAYGRQNRLDKELNREFAGSKTYLNGVKFHVSKKYLNLSRADEIRIYAGNNIYCGMNMVSADTAALCFLEKRKDSTSPPREQLLSLRNSNSAFNELLKPEIKEIIKDIPLYGTGNIYFGKRELVKDNVFMIGDAAAVIAPLAGDGIGMAFESAKIVSDILKQVKDKKLSINEAAGEYIKLHKEHFNKQLKTALLIQKLILPAYMRKYTLLLLNLYPGMLNRLIKATRN